MMTYDEMIAMYGDLEVEFSSYDKFVFRYMCNLNQGKNCSFAVVEMPRLHMNIHAALILPLK